MISAGYSVKTITSYESFDLRDFKKFRIPLIRFHEQMSLREIKYAGYNVREIRSATRYRFNFYDFFKVGFTVKEIRDGGIVIAGSAEKCNQLAVPGKDLLEYGYFTKKELRQGGYKSKELR